MSSSCKQGTKRAAVFCHSGLGDGVNMLALSHNLTLNGWEVDTFHNSLRSMQNWFPHLPIFPYPEIDALPGILDMYELFFVVQHDTYEFVLKLIREGKRRFPDRIKVLYLYASKNIGRAPFYSDCLTNPSLSVLDNLCVFCEKLLCLERVVRGNGFIIPNGLVHRRFGKRVAIHPTSTNPGKNWPKKKFIQLAKQLKEKGFEPVFIPGMKEKEQWVDAGIELAHFETLDLLASYLYESGYFIGNDSGLGHLASCLKVPTITLIRRKKLAALWAPSFHKGLALTPSAWIPNLRGFRIRDRHWGKFISVRRVWKSFELMSR